MLLRIDERISVYWMRLMVAVVGSIVELRDSVEVALIRIIPDFFGEGGGIASTECEPK